MGNRKSLVREPHIENNSGGVSLTEINSRIGQLREGYHWVLDTPIGGDAPKDVIRVYKYGEARKSKPKKWPIYIAKVGHKWYPIESITEYLCNQIGEILGLKMAESELGLADGQIRFLSKYFLRKNESLVHGAQIFSAYLNNDKEFVEEIERKGQAREFFTFQFCEKAIRYSFSAQYEAILKEFVKMLVLDAIIGNNDRHFYNWGVITHISNKRPPTFSPIYDTARGLFWNWTEERLERLYPKTKIDQKQFEKYINKSSSKTGWEGINEANHFTLIGELFKDKPLLTKESQVLLQESNLKEIHTLIETNFASIFTQRRLYLVKYCIEQRFNRLRILCNID